MNKKVYFILSGVIQILMSFSAIINANELAKNLTETMNAFAGKMDGTTGQIIKNGNLYIIFMAVICITLNSLIIYWASKDDLLRKKGKVIACSVISFFTSTYAIIELFAIINVIVMLILKRVNPEDYPPEKEKMPILEKEIPNKKEIIMTIILLVIYFSQFLWGRLQRYV